LQLNLSQYIFIPIPLHHARERTRGFNQSELIANQLGATFNVPVAAHALRRVRGTAPQASIKSIDGFFTKLLAWFFEHKKSSRATNVADCFSVTNPAAICGHRILLVDDVTTSGATLREATRALRDAGARSIVALVVARAR
jgi:predicted amidophosphoribosyltransferase